MKKNSTLPLLVVLLISSIIAVPAFSIKDPPGASHLVYASVGEPDTLDPAWCYDTASASLLINVYDTLLFLDGESVETYRPGMATSWTEQDIDETDLSTGIHWIVMYTLTIRSGVHFHTGGTIAPSDVEYSIERGMVQDRLGGPQWMFFLPLLDIWSSRDWDVGNSTHPGPDVPLVGMMIDHAISSDNVTGTVTIKAANKFNWIWQVLSLPYSSIMSMAWAATVPGEWSGAWGDYTGWIAYNNPAVSPIDELIIYPPPVSVDGGSGPFTIDYWNKGTEYSLFRFADYWDGWPASWPVAGIDPPVGYLERVTDKLIPDWAYRKPLFLAGDIDICDIPRNYLNDPELLAALTTGQIHLVKDLPTLTLNSFHFNFAVDGGSAYKPEMPAGTPRTDFFADAHIRRGFAYAFNYTQLIEQGFLGEAIQPTSWHIEGLAGPSIPNHYSIDLAKAADEFKQAFGGTVESPGPAWTQGFTAYIVYPITSSAPIITDMFEYYIESIPFPGTVDIVPVGVTWSTYLNEMVKKRLPAWIIGWSADYAHPDNLVRPYMHSYGDYAYFQSYSNTTVDMMIDTAVKLLLSDPTAQTHYWELQLEFYRSVPTIPLYQPVKRHYQQYWVQGWFYNPLQQDYRHYSKWKQDEAEHDMAVTSVVPSKSIVCLGQTVNINVTLRNYGRYSREWQSVNVTVYAGTTIIGTIRFIRGLPGVPWGSPPVNLTLTCDITGMPTGVYALSAVVDRLLFETDGIDNIRVDGNMRIVISGDINGDGKVDMRDIGAQGRAYGSTPGDGNWDPYADINNDGVVDMRDIGITARNFGAQE